MPGVRLSTIHVRLGEALSECGFEESRFPVEQFGRDPESRAHKTFAIGFPGDQDEPRQRRGVTRLVTGRAIVRLALRLQPDAIVASLRTAWDAFEDASLAIDDVDRTDGIHVSPIRRSFRTEQDWAIAELELELKYPHFSP